MKNFRVASTTAITPLLVLLLTACGAGGDTISQGVNTDMASAARATDAAEKPTCFLTDISKIRANNANRVDPEKLSAEDASLGTKDGSDEQSFVANVTASDLTGAGINATLIPKDSTVLLFVNHGKWGREDFLQLGGNDAIEGAREKVFPFPTVAWVLTVVDPVTHRGIQQLTSPDNECFRS